MIFTKLNIYCISVLFYLQTVINNILFDDTFQVNFIFSLYNICFSLSYCAIITKFVYNKCNILWHILTIAFIYSYTFFELKMSVFSSFNYIYKKFMNITIWNGMCLKYNYRNSIKSFITLSSILTVLENSKVFLVKSIRQKISNSNLKHFSCLINCLLIIFNLQIKNTKESNTLFFDLFSKKVIILFLFATIYNVIFFCDNLTDEISIVIYISVLVLQLFINYCAYNNYTKYILITMPVFLMISQLFIKSNTLKTTITNNIQLPIIYILCIQYNINGLIYALNISTIIIPTIIEYCMIQNIYINCFVFLLYIVLYYVYDIIKLNINKEIQTDEENSIKNNIDIILNE